jgi:hypothetical protein
VVDVIEMVKETTTMHKLPDYRWIAVLLGVVLAACNVGANPAATEETNTDSEVTAQLFEGFYASGPEMSSFVTCAMGELPGPGKGYWLVLNDEFSQLYGSPKGITMGDIAGTYGPYDEFAIYVRFEGILSSESGKGYGHLGLYIGEIQVTKALEASRRWVGSTYPQQVFRGCG